MAELDAQLRLDIGQALRDVDRLQGALDRAIAPIEIEVDDRQALELESTLREVERIANRAATETASIDLAAGRAEANFEDLARALNISEDAARRLTGEVLQSQAAANRLEDATRDVARQLGLSEDEARRFVTQLNRADKAAADVNTSTSGIGKALANVSIAAAALVAIRGAFNFAIDAKDAFATLQDSANAVKVVFGDAIGTIEAFGETVAQSAGLSTAEFNQSASVLGSALLNVGFSADTAATKTVELTQRAADMASIFGGPVGDALGAIQSALRGETDPIERFGVSLSEAAVNAQAAALGFQTVAGEFSTSEKAAARLDLIMQQTARTSGDFANTSGDLANAQKVLAAEFENAKASLGEALLPIFQTLLDIGPEVIASIEQLAPSIQAFAVSLGNMLEHREGALDLLDILNGFADLPRAFGEIGTTVEGLARGINATGGSLQALFAGDVVGAVRFFTDEVEKSGDLAQESLERINTQGLVDDIREGADAASALANRLGEVGRKGKLDPQFIRDLTRIAGTDLRETSAALVTLLGRAVELGQGSDDVEALRIALALLNDESRAEGPIRSVSDRIREIPDAIDTTLGPLGDLQLAADTAGVSLAEFALSTDPVATALFNALDPADQLAIKLDAVRGGAVTLTEAFGTNLTPAIFDASQALVDFDKNGKVTMREFIRGLREGVAEMIEFKGNLQTLYSIDPRVVPIILDLPLEEQIKRAEELVNDPIKIPLVIEASQDVEGIAALQQAAILKVMELVRTGMPEQTIADFITLQTDPTTGLGPEVADGLFAAWEFAKGTTQEFIAPDFTPIYIAAIEGIDTGAIQAATDQIFADLNPPTYPKPKIPPPPTAEEKSRVGDQILELFERDDALNEAAGFTAATFNERLIVEMGTRAFATRQELDAFITHNFTQEDAATTAAEATSGAYVDGLSAIDLGDLGLEDQIAATFASDDVLTAALLAGRDSREAYWAGASTPIAGEVTRFRTSIETTVNKGIGKASPPKLFLDAGIESAEAFWMGLEQTDGKISSEGMTAALQAALAVSFADVELPEFTPIVAASVKGLNTAAVTGEMDAALSASFADVGLPSFTPIFVESAGKISSKEVSAAFDAALGVSFADAEVPEFTPIVGRISAAELNAALNASFADVELPDFTPVISRGIQGVNVAQTQTELETALAASFADIELPGFTPLVVASVEGTNTAAVTAEMQAALGVSFADLELPEFTPTVTPTVGRISAAQMDAALGVSFADVELPELTVRALSTNTAEVTDEMNAALAASFADTTAPEFTPMFVEAVQGIDQATLKAETERILDADPDVDLLTAGQEARDTFMSGLSTPISGETGRLRQSILQTVNGAIQRQSPPKLFMDAGIESAEAFWLGFGESDLTLPDWLPHLAGQFPAIGEAAAGSFRTSFEQLEGELPAVIQRSAEAVNLTHFNDLGVAIARQLTTAVEGDFRLSPELDPLTAEQLLALNLDPITPVIGPADPLTVGQLQEMVDAANAARTVVESQLEAIQFDFELQGYQEQIAALTATTGELGTAAREAFMAGLSASTSEEVVQLRASILDAINSATESSSPSRLMLRLGGAAGDAFWMGFEQADMQLKVPIPTMTGKISTSTTADAAVAGGQSINIELHNLETRDADTTIARASQLIGAVAGTLNGNFKL